MKLLTLLLLLGLLAYVFRRRLKLALAVGGLLYAAIAVARLVLYGDFSTLLTQVAPEVALLGGGWLALWLLVHLVERRRHRADRRRAT